MTTQDIDPTPPGTDPEPRPSLRIRAAEALALLIGVFVFYTSFFGAFETLNQRASFVAMIVAMAVLLYPTGGGRRWRPLGIALDAAMGGWVLVSALYVIANFERIMVQLPFAEPLDVWLGFGTLLVVLELARRTASLVFPIIVGGMVAYAFFGDLIPGAFGHRGFDAFYITEVMFLSDRGLWGMLVSIASTTLAAFILFGALLLHTGAGQTFFDLSARAGGASPGGAAKIATIASGLFGSISGSSVANIATTGNFTIPLMKRLRYPASFAGGVEAVASTGGQLAPPIMGTAAFVMAELVGVNYWTIAAVAFLPAALFYLGVFTTVHLIAKRTGLGQVSGEDLPDWRAAANWRRLAPIFAGIAGLAWGICNGNSIQLTACYGMIGIMLAFTVATLSGGGSIGEVVRTLVRAFRDGGKGVVIVGILLVAAQVFVAMVNLTGVGVAVTSQILAVAGDNIWVIAGIMAVVCLIAGMGLPTSAAYVLVAAVFAPVLIQQGLDPVMVHLFVLYYAALSVITPPVCVAVFVSATIAEAPWLKVARDTLRLGGTAYALPMLFIAYPGLLLQGGAEAIAHAILSGVVFVLAVANLFAGQPVVRLGPLAPVLWIGVAVLALLPGWTASVAALALLVAAYAPGLGRPARAT
ncbi:TRAP transporter permease [Jannaschia aquimarina]|uniref:SiaT_12 protein n=1 Tax=Jannaschia aquimarina TaxID=935700 RepID=A0A0D1CMP3_9RHOB|nr:TRAP transporter fused permease subunit [Jannaschia aquimarina]KIT16067.1 Sialic acid TRAP transporter permease protein SiaT [Jannaschia aquimarina]SNT01537.1 TRAP transporter, 4TM/12TM fusion protein [Jannaschia aquimarina]